MKPFIYGGGQENGWRSGTENTPMIAGLGMAAKKITTNLDTYKNLMQETRDYLEERLEVSRKKIHFKLITFGLK